jgi:hypothetical protein
MRPDPDCECCSERKRTEHLHYDYSHYSICNPFRYAKVTDHKILYLYIDAPDLVLRVELDQLSIIFNVPHPLQLLYDMFMTNYFTMPS